MTENPIEDEFTSVQPTAGRIKDVLTLSTPMYVERGFVIEGQLLPAPVDSAIAKMMRENLIKNLLAHPTPIEHTPQRALPMTDHSDINDKDVNSYYWHLAPGTDAKTKEGEFLDGDEDIGERMRRAFVNGSQNKDTPLIAIDSVHPDASAIDGESVRVDSTIPLINTDKNDLGQSGRADPWRTAVEQALAEDYATGAEYFEAIKKLIQDGQGQVAIQLIDSLPEHLRGMNQVGKGMVVLPDADNITEEMVDASRGLHLYYSTGTNGVNCDDMRKHLKRYSPWSEQFWPEWFRESNDHLTKAGRALLAYALTVAAYQNPNAKQLYFDDASERNTSERMRVWDKPFHQGVQLTFKKPSGVTGTLVEQFVIKRPFSQANLVGENRYQLVLNRNDLPKDVRQHFKQQAVRVNMMLLEEGTKVEFTSTQVSYKGDVVLFDVSPVMASRW